MTTEQMEDYNRRRDMGEKYARTMTDKSIYKEIRVFMCKYDEFKSDITPANNGNQWALIGTTPKEKINDLEWLEHSSRGNAQAIANIKKKAVAVESIYDTELIDIYDFSFIEIFVPDATRSLVLNI